MALALYRLLAQGEPVARERLAEHAGASARDVARVLDEQPGTYCNDDGRVVAFWGLALGGMPHQLTMTSSFWFGRGASLRRLPLNAWGR